MIGNMEGLAQNSNTWAEIKQTLERSKAIGAQLSLICKAHGRITNVSKGSDFMHLDQNGCSSNCFQRRPPVVNSASQQQQQQPKMVMPIPAPVPIRPQNPHPGIILYPVSLQPQQLQLQQSLSLIN